MATCLHLMFPLSMREKNVPKATYVDYRKTLSATRCVWKKCKSENSLTSNAFMFAPEERRWPLRSKAIVAGMPLGCYFQDVFDKYLAVQIWSRSLSQSITRNH